MSHAPQYARPVVQKFLQKKEGKSPLAELQDSNYQEKGRRITTDGNAIFSYGWWEIARHDEEGRGVWLTESRYYHEDRRGRRIASPTTDGHIRAVRDGLIDAGYRETCFFGQHGTLWTKGLV